ncbi:MAG: non-canonical purine NTP pyrophosphatase [Lactobacillales bacterium]|jgi:XTP/dITP diphosphohydrolase|nr:non-canonical purine NTP pyrophosphatase [Lactobacillales bacterium]
MIEVLLASNNRAKVAELAAIDDPHVEIVSYREVSPEEIKTEETGKSYLENARLKAIDVATKTGRLTIGDDSGIVLEGNPNILGLYTMRYFREGVSDLEVNQELIRLADESGNRQFKLISSVVLVDALGQILKESSNELSGTIAHEILGDALGLDNVLIPDGESRSLAQMSIEERNEFSPRVIATRDVLKYFNDKVGN